LTAELLEGTVSAVAAQTPHHISLVSKLTSIDRTPAFLAVVTQAGVGDQVFSNGILQRSVLMPSGWICRAGA